MAAPDMVRLKLSLLFAVFSSSKQGAFIGDDQLQQATINTLDNVVAPPVCGAVIGGLEADLDGWLADPDAPHIRVVVVPPREKNGIVDIWSQGHDCEVLTPPPSSVLLSEYKFGLGERLFSSRCLATVDTQLLDERPRLVAFRDRTVAIAPLYR
ncbi:hypothetical protein [Citromicrobium sp. WPS32]|uniref:hypothetical protein n=1 Tax=Citromicrobium sp. WPS32 TaxID=1634517 RepID=UPI0006C92578|nr:hypothetical protein [Citromicrobium sp. WPS32]KPM15577.1 hypothetical protein WG75_05715 [Citromicrobium sp. WPS32]